LLGFLNKKWPNKLIIPSCNTDQGVHQRWKNYNEKIRIRNESKRVWKKGKLFKAKLGVMMGDYKFLFDHLNYFWYNPKDDDLYMTRIKPVEKQVEVRRAFWRANRCSKLCKGAKYSSNHLVAGFLRSFPQDSCVWQ